jgi:hypothetical protein
MKRNMGTFDRAARGLVLAPSAAVAAVLLGPASLAAIVLFAVAAVMGGTALAGFCPLYAVLGIDTCGRGRLTHA